MKRLTILFTLLLMTILLFNACGSGGNTAPLSNDSKGAILEKSDQYNYEPADDSSREVTKTNELTQNKKIIKNAELDIETTNAKETYNKILEFAKQNGGYEFSKNLSVSGDYNVISAKIKIDPTKLDAMIAFIDDCSDVINSNVYSDDITAEYFDTELRLKSMRESLKSYYKLLESAKNVEEILQVQKTIDSITTEIEGLEGQIKYWDKAVSESTIAIEIHEKNDPVKVSKQINWNTLSFKDMGYIMKSGLLGVTNFIVTAIQWIVIVIVSIFPIVLIAGIALFVLLYIRRRRNNKKK